MSGNYINSPDRDILLELKIPKPPNRYQPTMLVIVVLCLIFAATTFFSDNQFLFACALSLLIFGVYKYVYSLIVLNRLWQYYEHIKIVQDIMTFPVEREEQGVKIYSFIQPDPELLQKLLQLHVYAKSLRSSNK